MVELGCTGQGYTFSLFLLQKKKKKKKKNDCGDL